jgi:D-beta-D-heptose 7-phosphate kinase/D-beta-D-heptose 1-phosphate adenosyltransferase
VKVVFVNGTFDLLHLGHLALLTEARSHGDRLVVGVDTDDRVRQRKGPGRPVQDQATRAAVLRALRVVDEVHLFSTDEQLRDLVKETRPAVMLVGSDYRNQPVIGSEHAGHLIFFDRIGGISTTATLARAGLG